MVIDRGTIISNLADWNGWWTNGEVPDILQGKERIMAIPFNVLVEQKEIKTVSGIRRCGKSTLVYQMISNRIGAGVPVRNILFINFDDKVISGIELSDLIEIFREEVSTEGPIDLFLDEVHNCPDWVSTLRKMYDLKKLGQVFVTDSSSSYISGEYTTLISGRTIDIRLHPLSFREYVRWSAGIDASGPFGGDERAMMKRCLEQYMKWGGYPEIVLAKSDLHRKILLKDYLDSIIYKDMVERYNANQERLKVLVGYLLSNPASLFSPRKFSRRHSFSLETIDKYLEYMKEVNFIHSVPSFDHSYDKVLRSPKKIYIEDTGLSRSYGFNFMEGKGKLLENAVFNEVNRQGFEIFYWSDGKSECDLLLKKGKEIPLSIQVCQELREDNLERELRGLEGCMDEYDPVKGILVLGHSSDLDTNGFEKVEAWRFLLEPDRYLDPGSG